MSAIGIALVVITASLVKCALCSGQSAHSPTLTVYDDYENTTPGTDRDPRVIVTLQLPHLSDETPTVDFGHERQKRNYKNKRQFSPWGGKRIKPTEGGTKILPQKRSIIPLSIRSFGSWGGKRNFYVKDWKRPPLSGESKVLILSSFDKNPKHWYKKNGSFGSWGGKRSFGSWGGKKSFGSWGGKRSFGSWGGKRSFDSWGGKRSFGSWGGKRSFGSWGGKRSFGPWGGKRSFGPWGGKRTFGSWGGKRSFDSWGGKRADNSLLENEALTPEEENVYNKWKRNQDNILQTTAIQ